MIPGQRPLRIEEAKPRADIPTADTADRRKMIADLLRTGRASLQQGDFPAALVAFREIVRLDSNHVGARGDIVIALYRQGKIQPAVKAAKEALLVAPKNVGLLTQLGNLLNERTNWTDAEAAFRAALDIDPAFAGALGGLASTHNRQGRGEEAIAVLQKAVALWPKNVGFQVRLGQVLEEHHRLAEARAAFQAAVSIDRANLPGQSGLRRVRNPNEIFAMFRGLLANPQDQAISRRLSGELALPPAELARLIAFARNPSREGIGAIARTPFEREILEAILVAVERRDYRSQTGASAPSRGDLFASSAVDTLAEPASHENWIPAQWLSSFVLRQTPVSRRAAAVVTMRDEGLYVLEWIAHYRVLGFDSIFVYSNDNIDGSETLLRALAARGVITYIENEMGGSGSHHPQRKAYAHALHLLPELWEHEWVLFADCDELLVPDQSYGLSIAALIDDALQHNPLRAPSAICFNWFLCFSDFAYSYDPGLMLERFQHGEGRRGMKSLVRLRDIFSMHLIHFPDMDHEGFLVMSDFKVMEKSKRQKRLDPVFASARLNHYWAKSFEEFSVKKARGDAAGDRDRLWKRDFKVFFTMNGRNAVENYAPPPAALIAAVRVEVENLQKLPGVAEAAAAVKAALPQLLARFDRDGGLTSVYQAGMDANSASANGVF